MPYPVVCNLANSSTSSDGPDCEASGGHSSIGNALVGHFWPLDDPRPLRWVAEAQELPAAHGS